MWGGFLGGPPTEKGVVKETKGETEYCIVCLATMRFFLFLSYKHANIMVVAQIINAANVLIPSFIKADSSNLPPIDCLTLDDFFSTDHRYVLKEGRNEKMQRAMSESYGDGWLCSVTER